MGETRPRVAGLPKILRRRLAARSLCPDFPMSDSPSDSHAPDPSSDVAAFLRRHGIDTGGPADSPVSEAPASEPVAAHPVDAEPPPASQPPAASSASHEPPAAEPSPEPGGGLRSPRAFADESQPEDRFDPIMPAAQRRRRLSERGSLLLALWKNRMTRGGIGLLLMLSLCGVNDYRLQFDQPMHLISGLDRPYVVFIDGTGYDLPRSGEPMTIRLDYGTHTIRMDGPGLPPEWEAERTITLERERLFLSRPETVVINPDRLALLTRETAWYGDLDDLEKEYAESDLSRLLPAQLLHQHADIHFPFEAFPEEVELDGTRAGVKEEPRHRLGVAALELTPPHLLYVRMAHDNGVEHADRWAARRVEMLRAVSDQAVAGHPEDDPHRIEAAALLRAMSPAARLAVLESALDDPDTPLAWHEIAQDTVRFDSTDPDALARLAARYDAPDAARADALYLAARMRPTAEQQMGALAAVLAIDESHAPTYEALLRLALAQAEPTMATAIMRRWARHRDASSEWRIQTAKRDYCAAVGKHGIVASALEDDRRRMPAWLAAVALEEGNDAAWGLFDRVEADGTLTDAVFLETSRVLSCLDRDPVSYEWAIGWNHPPRPLDERHVAQIASRRLDDVFFVGAEHPEWVDAAIDDQLAIADAPVDLLSLWVWLESRGHERAGEVRDAIAERFAAGLDWQRDTLAVLDGDASAWSGVRLLPMPPTHKRVLAAACGLGNDAVRDEALDLARRLNVAVDPRRMLVEDVCED